jgi:hypothetical protein
MPRFNVLWRFVVDAVDEEEAQATAGEVARLAAVEAMPPVARYEEPPQWMTDHVVVEEAEDIPSLFGRCLARAGRLGNEWTASGLSNLAEGGECFATFNAGERNRPAVAGLKWGLVEVWPAG